MTGPSKLGVMRRALLKPIPISERKESLMQNSPCQICRYLAECRVNVIQRADPLPCMPGHPVYEKVRQE